MKEGEGFKKGGVEGREDNRTGESNPSFLQR